MIGVDADATGTADVVGGIGGGAAELRFTFPRLAQRPCMDLFKEFEPCLLCRESKEIEVKSGTYY